VSENVCRFGILSTAGIARKNWKAIRIAGNARVAAVASRNVESAKRFIDECSVEVPQVTRPLAFGSYEELLASDHVDAVYIPLPTALRQQWVIKAAQAGKHVIGEKPAALDASQVNEMLDCCRQHNVQYMDGVMFMHSQRLPMIRAIIDSGKIGEVRRVASQFSFNGGDEFNQHNIRSNSSLEPHGCMGDLGWYCIRFFNWLFDGQLPVEVRARSLFPLQGDGSPGSVPGEISCELTYSNGVTASFYNSFRTQHQQWVHISGTEGYLRLDDFVLPYRGSEVAAYVGRDHFMIDNCSFHMENHLSKYSVREYDAGENTSQEVRMIRAFADQVLSGTITNVWPEWTLKTQQVLDACFESSKKDGAAVRC
jgi:predicted dehydrogenase